jgi:hypothetical protein
MGFMDNIKSIFGGKKSSRSAGASGAPQMLTADPPSHGKPMSMLSMLEKLDGEISYNTCAEDSETSAVTGCTVIVLTTDRSIANLKLDVGGHCKKCNAYRCGRHSVWNAVPINDARRLGLTKLIAPSLPAGEDFLDVLVGMGKLDTICMLSCRRCHTAYIGPMRIIQL